MNRDEHEMVMRALHAAYPSQEITEDMLALWREALSTEEYDPVHRAVVRWTDHEKWWPTIAELRAMIRDAKDDGRDRELSGAVRCAGYGWISIGDQTRPCPTCSPALWRIFRDPKLLLQWRNGRAVHTIFRMSRDEFSDEYRRPRCQPPVGEELPLDPGDRMISPEEGREVAERAYSDEERRQGREPSEGALRTIRGLG